MTLEILICTLGDGILNVPNMLLPQLENIRYLISWQIPTEYTTPVIPAELIRKDITVVTTPGIGLSKNRNNAFKNATADICLIADDDLKYTASQLQKVITTFEENHSVDLATFKSKVSNKYFPDYSFNLTSMPRKYYVISFEIAFRRTKIQNKIWFNELFGLGSPVLSMGEEEIFILDCLAEDINAMYFPIEIVQHDAPTTSVTKKNEPGSLMARGAYLARRHPKQKYLRAIKIALQLSKESNVSFSKAIHYIIKGISYAHKMHLHSR